jgi:hypothetical protein
MRWPRRWRRALPIVGVAAIAVEVLLLFVDITPHIQKRPEPSSDAFSDNVSFLNKSAWRVIYPRMRLTVPRCSPIGHYGGDFWKTGDSDGDTAALVTQAQRQFPNIAFEYLYHFIDMDKGWGSNGIKTF